MRKVNNPEDIRNEVDMIAWLRAEAEKPQHCDMQSCIINDATAIFREIDGDDEALKHLCSLMLFIQRTEIMVPPLVIVKGRKEDSLEKMVNFLEEMRWNYSGKKDPEGFWGEAVALMEAMEALAIGYGEKKELINHLAALALYATHLNTAKRTVLYLRSRSPIFNSN